MNAVRERLKLVRRLLEDEQDSTIEEWGKSSDPRMSFLSGKLAGMTFALGLIDFAAQEAQNGDEKSGG